MYWWTFHALASYLPIIPQPRPGLSDPSVSQRILEQRLLTLGSSWRGSLRHATNLFCLVRRNAPNTELLSTFMWGGLTFQHETTTCFKQLHGAEFSLISWYLLSWSQISSFYGTWGFITMAVHSVKSLPYARWKKKKRKKKVNLSP
jgi:hypothetical protein